MIINRIYETQNLLSLWLVSFLVGLRTYQHPCTCRADLLMMWFKEPLLQLLFQMETYECTVINISRNSVKAQTLKEFVYCWDSEKNKREFPEDFGTQYALTLCFRKCNKISAFSLLRTPRQCGKNSVLAYKTIRQMRIFPRI